VKKRYYWFLFILLYVLLLPTNNGIELLNFKSKTILVEVKGAVAEEKVYRLKAYSTIENLLEVIELNNDADISNLNKTMVLKDKDVIVINAKSEIDKVSINSATLDQLTSLPNIGEKIAQRIIDYRTQVSSFRSIEDIMNVKGIGEKMFEKIKDLITL